jgi:hypothetical protein
MSEFENILNQIKDNSVQEAKNEFQQLLSEAKGSSEQFIRDNSAMVKQWIVLLSTGEIDKEEFDDLIADQKLVAEQFVNTQAIGAQARTQRLTMQLLDLTITTIAPALLAVLEAPESESRILASYSLTSPENRQTQAQGQKRRERQAKMNISRRVIYRRIARTPLG